MLDFIGTIVLVAAIIVSINALTGAMPISTAQRLAVSVGAGLWTGLAAALAGANLFLGTNPVGPPVIGTVIAFPLVATAVAASISPAVRASLLGMPMPFLIGLNVWRLGGGFFLLLAAEGRLAGPFPYSAGWGDIITGALALPVAWLALRGQGKALVWGWNAFGMLDLVVALALGITSASGSPLQIIHVGVGSAGVQVLPWSLIPTVLVPMFLIVHAVIFAQLARAGRGAEAS
ncbi:hypothetical protein [Bradyrhizobium valentinum]|uniref:Uncharacterized protein n=1 Tax=Bradyrhizobium valentinum TaxID=1518501 RepID=A0A0R3KFF8_9BRAD|nr:hypothetical protein [Bradyrhizobium valentinum]KRQ94535.1 hypothetical protein CQ10_06560 [Bradyrhizobium valentinum]KRR08440.1 hypothetical protein CP49_31335 [Bradyrhizobium valentinum]